jgi:hypothetical protein
LDDATKRERKRAIRRKYEASPNGKAKRAEYEHSERRKHLLREKDKRRIRIGRDFDVYAKTIDQAETANRIIKERLSEFKQRQSGHQKAEGGATG